MKKVVISIYHLCKNSAPETTQIKDNVVWKAFFVRSELCQLNSCNETTLETVQKWSLQDHSFSSKGGHLLESHRMKKMK